MIELFLYIFIGFCSLGPGVCVWLALSDLLPTRIRSNGMRVALVINQLVFTTMIDTEVFCEGNKEPIIEAAGVDRFRFDPLLTV
jgi:Sugar (and other) transporter